MDASFLDFLVQHFRHAFAAGGATLHAVMLPLLVALGGFAWSVATVHIVATSGGRIDIFISLAIVALSIAVHVFVFTHYAAAATSVFTWFAAQGAAVGGMPQGAFLSPSTVLTMGLTVAEPILTFLFRIRSWFFTNPVTMILMLLALLVIVLTFAKQTRHVIMTLLSFELAVMVAPILLPYALLTQTKTLAEMAISWLFTTCVQIFLLSAVLGLGRGLIDGIVPMLAGGATGDPTVLSAFLMAVSSWMLLVLADQVVVQAAAAGARFGFGLTGHTLIPAGLGTLAGSAMQYAAGGVAGVAAGAVSRLSSAIRERRAR